MACDRVMADRQVASEQVGGHEVGSSRAGKLQATMVSWRWKMYIAGGQSSLVERL